MTFKKLALVTAIAAAPMATFAAESLDDAMLGGVTGQDGISLSLDLNVTTNAIVHDTDGIDNVSTTYSFDGAIIITGMNINTGGNAIVVEIDAGDVSTAAGTAPVLNVNVSIPTGTTIQTGDLTVGNSNRDDSAWGFEAATESGVIMSNATITLLRQHVGIWEGDYTHIDPADRSVQESYAFRIKVECPDYGPIAYRQTSRYRWSDGRTSELVYTGIAHDDRLLIDDGRIRGEIRAIEPQTLYMRFGFSADPGNQVTEMIQLSRDGLHRARTWHWLRDEQLWRITLVRERRTSHDPSDW